MIAFETHSPGLQCFLPHCYKWVAIRKIDPCQLFSLPCQSHLGALCRSFNNLPPKLFFTSKTISRKVLFFLT